MLAISAMYGFVSGNIQAVVPATVAYLCPDLSISGPRLGMTLAVGGLGLLVGPPIAGATSDSQSMTGRQTYRDLLEFCGGTVFLSGSLQVVTRIIKVGLSLKKS